MRYLTAKIAVYISRCECGGGLRTPDDAVEFLPWVAEIVAVEVDDDYLAVLDHHISDVIVTVLIALRAIFQQMSVCREVVENVMIALKFQRAFEVHSDLAVDFCIEARLPIGLVNGRGDRVDEAQILAGFIAEAILLIFTHIFDCFFRVNALDEALEHIISLVALAAFDRSAHRNAECRDLLLHTEHILVSLAARGACHAQKKDVAVSIDSTVFFIARPALVDLGQAEKS